MTTSISGISTVLPNNGLQATFTSGLRPLVPGPEPERWASLEKPWL